MVVMILRPPVASPRSVATSCSAVVLSSPLVGSSCTHTAMLPFQFPQMVLNIDYEAANTAPSGPNFSDSELYARTMPLGTTKAQPRYDFSELGSVLEARISLTGCSWAVSLATLT